MSQQSKCGFKDTGCPSPLCRLPVYTRGCCLGEHRPHLGCCFGWIVLSGCRAWLVAHLQRGKLRLRHRDKTRTERSRWLGGQVPECPIKPSSWPFCGTPSSPLWAMLDWAIAVIPCPASPLSGVPLFRPVLRLPRGQGATSSKAGSFGFLVSKWCFSVPKVWHGRSLWDPSQSALW